MRMLSKVLFVACIPLYFSLDAHSQTYELSLFKQKPISSFESSIYIGTHAPLSYYNVGKSEYLSGLPKNKMNLVLWADDPSYRLRTPIQEFQKSGNEIRFSMDSKNFPMNNAFHKGTQVASVDFDKISKPFEDSLDDKLEISFELKVPKAKKANGGEVNVWAYFLLTDQSDPSPSNKRYLCFGAGAFDLRKSEARKEFIFADPETGCAIINLPLGASGLYNLANGKTAKFASIPFSDFRKFTLTIDGNILQKILVKVNKDLPLRGYSLNPKDYSLPSIVINPEIYIPRHDSESSIELSLRNLQVINRRTYSLIGNLDSILLEPNGNWYASGWACTKNYDSPVSIGIFSDRPYESGGTAIAMGTANLANMALENSVCRTTPGRGHRFKIQIPSSEVVRVGTKAIYLQAVRATDEPSVLLPGSGSTLLGNGSVSNLSLIPAIRWEKNGDRFYGTNPNEGIVYGYRNEGAFFKVAQMNTPGGIPLYRCSAGPHHFLLNDSGCNGYTQEGLLGYAQGSAVQGLRPLYLFYQKENNIHLATTDFLEGLIGGYQLENNGLPMGYVW